MSDLPPFTENYFHLAFTLYLYTGGGTPFHEHMMAWMQDVQPGDYVIETTARRVSWESRIGRFEAVVREPDVGTVFRLTTPAGPRNWSNARIARIPVTEHERLAFGHDLDPWSLRPCMPTCSGCSRETFDPGRDGSQRQRLRRLGSWSDLSNQDLERVFAVRETDALTHMQAAQEIEAELKRRGAR